MIKEHIRQRCTEAYMYSIAIKLGLSLREVNVPVCCLARFSYLGYVTVLTNQEIPILCQGHVLLQWFFGTLHCVTQV